MPRFDKHFSIEEARACLPDLRRRFEAIRALYQELDSLRGEYEQVRATIQMNGHAPKTTVFEERMTTLQELVKEIMAQGIEIKDISRGLVDFPHWRDGEEVFLCWELGEDDLRYWHRIEDGYPGRQPL